MRRHERQRFLAPLFLLPMTRSVPKLPHFVLCCAWGSLCGGVLGALRTREAVALLLARNRALESLGVPSLPGPSHWGILSSLRPGAAGALFFGLSLGLGLGALSSLWVGATRDGSRPWVRWSCLAAPLWAAAAGDWCLALALLAITGAACVIPQPTLPRRTGLAVLCACVTALGLWPWATASEGAFTRLRDRFLLSTQAGLALDQFYYRWTLYPAEALKTIAARSQPTATVSRDVPAMDGENFRTNPWLGRVLWLPSEASAWADVKLVAGESGLALEAGSVRVPWPSAPEERAGAWQALLRKADRTSALRQATAFALLTGCPIGLAWALGSVCVWGGGTLRPTRPAGAAFAMAMLAAAALCLAGLPNRATEPPTPDETARALASAHPADRLRGVSGAAALGQRATPLLLRALSDPVVNVRYAAAEALGTTGGDGAGSALLQILRGGDEWYVKERAYAALWRLGWRPQPR